MKVSWPLVRNLAALVWSAPYGVLGWLVMYAFMAIGWVYGRTWSPWFPARFVHVRGPLARYLKNRGWDAFTLGWVVFFWGGPGPGVDPIEVQLHEEAHLTQGYFWGPIFPVLYLVFLAVFGYEANPFEAQARASVEIWKVQRARRVNS